MAEFVPPPGTEFLTVLKCKFYGMTNVIPTEYSGNAKPKLPPLRTVREMLRKNRPTRQAIRLVCTDKGVAGVSAKTGRLIFRFSTAMIATLLSSRHPDAANRRVGMLLCRVRGHSTWYVFKYPPQCKKDPLCAVMKRIVAHNLQRLGRAALRDAQPPRLGSEGHNRAVGGVGDSRARTHSWALTQSDRQHHNYDSSNTSTTAAASAQRLTQHDPRMSRPTTRHGSITMTTSTNNDDGVFGQFPQGHEYANYAEVTGSSRAGSPVYYVGPTPIREDHAHSYAVVPDHPYVSFTSSPVVR